MADITLVKISALPAVEQIGAEDLLPVVQEGATKAVAYGVIKDDIANELAPDATLSEAGKAADAKAVGDALALKADKTELTAEVSRIDAVLATKANTNDVNAALTTKANADDVTAALALKADTATVNAELATKANIDTVNAALALKADKTELAAGLATKQNVLTFDSAPIEGSTNPVTSGGVWEAVQTDKNLAVEDKAADAKTTGNRIAELKDEIDDIVNITGRTFDLTWKSGYTINANPATGSFSIEPYTGRRYAGPFKSTNDFTVVPNINNVGVIATDANGNSTYASGWFSAKKTIDASIGTYFYILCSFDNDTNVPDVSVDGQFTGYNSLSDVIEYVVSNNIFEFSRGTTSDGITFTDSSWVMYQTNIAVLPFDLTIPLNTLSRVCVYTYSDISGTSPVQHWDANRYSDYVVLANTPFRMIVMYRTDVSGTELVDKAGMYESPLYKSLILYAGKFTGYNLIHNIYNEYLPIRHIPLNRSFRLVNHRGYSQQYPENTILSFKKSKERGFESVETDVRFTSDGVAVLLHDESINRTARSADGSAISGTVNIASITYETALTYDFGIYKGAAFAGQKIPTLDEFLLLCRNIGLCPYIELKVGTKAQIESVCEAVIKTGMRKNVTWVSYSSTLLGYVKNIDASARLGLISNTIVSADITTAEGLRTGSNDVFLTTDYNNVTDAIVDMCVDANIPMEVFTVDGYSALENLNLYASGITTNWLLADKYLYDKYMM